MKHTAKEQLSIYKEKHNQFQPSRTDAEDWERTTREAMNESNKRSARQEQD